MKCYKQIITVFLAVAIAFACCLPAVVTPAHAAAPAAAFDQVGSDASITLNNGDVLRVPSEAITGNYIVYRVNNGVYRYYVIDVFESTDGVKEMAFLSFTRYVGQHAITNANALSPNVWTIYGMQNVLYAISGALTVRPMYSTFDYYDALGFLLIGGDGSETTEEDFSGTFEVDTPENEFMLPREVMGEQFMILNDPKSTSLDTIQIITFPNYEDGKVYEGAFGNYDQYFISGVSVKVVFDGITFNLPNDFDFSAYPYLYFYVERATYSNSYYFLALSGPAVSTSSYKISKSNNMGFYYYYSESDSTWKLSRTLNAGDTCRSSKAIMAWSNADICMSASGLVTWSASNSCVSSVQKDWTSTSYSDCGFAFVQDGWNVLYSTFDYCDSEGNVLFSNSFAGEVAEDDALVDLTLNDGSVIRVPERFGELDSHYVVMDPVGGTEETAYLIYEFDYYEGVADGTVCDFTRWYGVATTEQVEVPITDPDTGETSTSVETATSWEWNYQDYYVTELDILDYGPIVYSTFEYVDGRPDDDTEDDGGGSGATSEEVKGFWNKLFVKLDEILTAIKKIGGSDVSISIENNTIIDDEDKEPFNPDVYKGVIKTLRNSVKLFSGFFGFIYDGVNNFIVYLTDTSSEFYGLFHLSGLG